MFSPIDEMARQSIDRFNLHVRLCGHCGDPPNLKLCLVGAVLEQAAQDMCAAKVHVANLQAEQLERRKALV